MSNTTIAGTMISLANISISNKTIIQPTDISTVLNILDALYMRVQTVNIQFIRQSALQNQILRSHIDKQNEVIGVLQCMVADLELKNANLSAVIQDYENDFVRDIVNPDQDIATTVSTENTPLVSNRKKIHCCTIL